MSFKIDKLTALPEGVKQATSFYEEILTRLNNSGVGVYMVTVQKNKPVTVYQQLYKRTKGNANIKLHKINDKVYVEILATGTPKPLGSKK
ncbi:MAG: hypothetical protein ABSF65_05905 [Candidatus Bathyarchaeia archaeon]|jgi:hypothetical protein